MNLDNTSIYHIFSFIYSKSSPHRTDSHSLAPFGVCKAWRAILCGPSSVPFWQGLFHERFPRFLNPVSPSKKRTVSAASLDYRLLFLYTSNVLQIESSSFNPANENDIEDKLVELPQDTTRYRRELMESIALRMFSRKFTQFKAYNRHHLLYGPAGCGKATLIESLARMWGSHLITLRYPAFVRVSSKIDWSGYADVLCNYLLSFCESNTPTIIHIHNMGFMNTLSTQNALNSLLKSVSVSTVWVIGTTTSPNMSVQHAEHLTARLHIPFPAASEREAFLKAQLMPASLATSSSPSQSLPIHKTLSFSEAVSPSNELSSSSPPPVAAASIHLLALRTCDFTYLDLKALCHMLRQEFLLTDQKNSLPFVKLMDVLSKVVPMYRPDDAKRYEGVDHETVAQHTTAQPRRRLSVPTVI